MWCHLSLCPCYSELNVESVGRSYHNHLNPQALIKLPAFNLSCLSAGLIISRGSGGLTLMDWLFLHIQTSPFSSFRDDMSFQGHLVPSYWSRDVFERAGLDTNKAICMSKMTFDFCCQTNCLQCLKVCTSIFFTCYLMISSSSTGSARVESVSKPNECQLEVTTSFPGQSEKMNCKGRHFKLRLAGNFTLPWIHIEAMFVRYPRYQVVRSWRNRVE